MAGSGRARAKRKDGEVLNKLRGSNAVGLARSRRPSAELPRWLLIAFLVALTPLLSRAEEPAKGAQNPDNAPVRCPASDDLVENESQAPADADLPLKFVRQPGEADENAEINGRVDWRWRRLTYPTGRLPFQPCTRLRS